MHFVKDKGLRYTHVNPNLTSTCWSINPMSNSPVQSPKTEGSASADKANPKNVLRRLGSRLTLLIGKSLISVSGQADAEPIEAKITAPGKREKKPLQRALPPATVYPVEALGEILGGAARAIQKAIQAPIDICGSSVLAAAHLAGQAHADVVVDGRVSPISNFFITVGGSGERKTAVDNAALKEHRAYEKQLCGEFYADQSKFKNKSTAFDKALNVALSTSGSVESRTTAADLVGSEPAPPIEAAFICSEPSYEGLCKKFAVGRSSQGLFSNEGGAFLHGYAMGKEKKAATIAGFSGLWDATPIDRVRAGEGSTKLFGRRFSMHILVQPSMVKDLMQDPMSKDQGFLSRTCICIPESTVGTRFYREIDLADSPSLAKYYDRMRDLLQRIPVVEDESDRVLRSQLKPRQLTLSAAAKSVYILFHDFIEARMGGDMKEIRAFANKAPEHLLRIAGVLALVENSDATEISGSQAESARALVAYFLSEAHRLEEVSRQDPDLILAQSLLEWIQKLDRAVSLVEIYQSGPTDLRNAKSARYIANVLVDHGHITPTKSAKYRGRVRAEGWSVVP
jgi:hypothetical protein